MAELTLAQQVLGRFFGKIARPEALLGAPELRERALEACGLATQGSETFTLFVELPLAGPAGFDLHAYPLVTHQEQRQPQAEEHIWQHWPQTAPLFEWCALQPAGQAEAGYAFDLQANPRALQEPCLYTAFFTPEKGTVPQSMALMQGERFDAALGRLLAAAQPEHSVYYTGVMHGRDLLVAHLGFKVAPQLAQSYGQQPGLLSQHLQLMGFSDEGSQLAGFEPFAAQGFAHDVQFAFDEHGPLEETLAFSLVPGGGAGARAQRMRSGDIAQMLAFLEEQGLADARWRELLPAMGTWMLPCVVDGAAVPCVAGFGIGYVKFRWSNGAPAAPAKLYIELRASLPRKEA